MANDVAHGMPLGMLLNWGERFLRTSVGVFVIFISCATGCGWNVLEESADKNSDAALLFEARKQMNDAKWADAITLIQKMSQEGQTKRETRATLASAYAGRCGLNLIHMADSIAQANGINFFPVLLRALRGATSDSIVDCENAEAQILSIASDPEARLADENVMMAFIGFAKVGAILAANADPSGTGTADPIFDSCDRGQLSEHDLRQLGTGLTISISSLSASGSSIAAGLADAVTDVCAAAAGINPDFDFCEITDPADFSAEHLQALGTIVKMSDNPGLGTCTGGLMVCGCPP
jgi:hypothetical protein